MGACWRSFRCAICSNCWRRRWTWKAIGRDCHVTRSKLRRAGGSLHIGIPSDIERLRCAPQNGIEEKFMAGSILQRSSERERERERELTQRPEYSDDYGYRPYS